MFDWLIPLLIVTVLLMAILEYLEVLDVVTGVLDLIAAAVVGTVKLAARLVRRLAGSSKPQP